MFSYDSGPRFRGLFAILALLTFALLPSLGLGQTPTAQPATARQPISMTPKVYVILWFDTEDYLLPADDDATLRLADWLHREGIRATFKLVGEKARTLERRRRFDVIEALKKHEIGYHTNFHSVQPTPALYLAYLGWDEGVAEFDRRERAGIDDIKRIFGVTPTCYGQPGSSWAPQTFGALRNWNMRIYLDAGSHVRLDDKPHYYCGVLTLYRLAHHVRTSLRGEADLRSTEDRFLKAREQLLAEGGGVVSIYYHPCEFVHREFWDAVNFRHGANPPRSQWKPPPAKTPEESEAAFANFEGYIRFIKRFPDVQFITASEAAALYADAARGRVFNQDELLQVAKAVRSEVTFQRHGDWTLAPSEIFWLLNHYLAGPHPNQARVQVRLPDTPYGPPDPGPKLDEPMEVDSDQFFRTVEDVNDYLRLHGRIPSAVWLGSKAVPPESFLQALASVSALRLEGKPIPERIVVPPARLAAADYVADDDPKLWSWIIFPPNHRAPAMMALAKRQAWTLKPAVLRPEALSSPSSSR